MIHKYVLNTLKLDFVKKIHFLMILWIIFVIAIVLIYE